jgi:lysozyme family protein
VTAVRALQNLLGVPDDGILGARTQAALASMSWRLVNNALVGARVRFLEAIVDRDATQLVFLHGWIRRAVSFYVT